MIGATLSLSIILWLASSYVEYKIVSASPHLKKYFYGVPGIAISVIISLTLGVMLAPAAGTAVMLAAFLGLATNEFTYKLYDGLHRFNTKRVVVQQKVSNFKAVHPTVFNEAVEGIKAGFKVIGGIVLAIVWIFGLPVRIVRWTQAANRKLHTAFTR